MTDLATLKQTVNDLYKTNPNIHISVSIGRQKIHLQNQEATIIAVYPNFFIIESEGKQHTFKYLDLFTNSIDIPEIGEGPFLSNKAKLSEHSGGRRNT